MNKLKSILLAGIIVVSGGVMAESQLSCIGTTKSYSDSGEKFKVNLQYGFHEVITVDGGEIWMQKGFEHDVKVKPVSYSSFNAKRYSLLPWKKGSKYTGIYINRITGEGSWKSIHFTDNDGSGDWFSKENNYYGYLHHEFECSTYRGL